MPRKPRRQSSFGIYHFIARGVNKKKLFHTSKDYKKYLELVIEYRDQLNLQIYHYCLMNNHIHLLLKAPDLEILGKFAHFTHRRYAYYYCKTHLWSEQVFRRGFISVPINDETYLLECGRYIDRNPVEAKLVSRPEEYAYSSYQFYAQAKDDRLVVPSPAYLALGNSDLERQALYKFYTSQPRMPIEGAKEVDLTVPF